MPTKGLKKHLKTLSQEELINHIVELDKKYKPVQEYHQVYLAADLTEFIEKQKKIIENEFFPKRGLPKMRFSIARKAISDARKMGFPPEDIADLMLFYVENGVNFTNEYGDIHERFYTSMENMFYDALSFIHSQGFHEKFQDRAYVIVENSENIGWGFPDTIGDYYHEYFS